MFRILTELRKRAYVSRKAASLGMLAGVRRMGSMLSLPAGARCTAAVFGLLLAGAAVMPAWAIPLAEPDEEYLLYGEYLESAAEEEEPETETELSSEQMEEWLSDNSAVPLDVDYITGYKEECWDLIFFGDSRVVGMSEYAGGYHYVGRVSAGYSYMAGDGYTALTQMMADWPYADIVFCFGVNDPGNVDSYIGFYQSFLAAYPDRRAWFMAVTPVSEVQAAAAGYQIRNAQIEAFNAALQSAFPDRYIDCYTYLMENGVNTGDGVHYDGTTYAAEQDFTWRTIQEILEQE